MWMRRTFHECASELEQVSSDFRAAYTAQLPSAQALQRDQILQESSKRGIEILQVLTLAIRNEQDYGLVENPSLQVGAIKESVSVGEINGLIQNYSPPYSQLTGFEPLILRQALNKIAHSNPNQNGVYASRSFHDLILSGSYRSKTWLAVVSVIDLYSVIKSLPDRSVTTCDAL